MKFFNFISLEQSLMIFANAISTSLFIEIIDLDIIYFLCFISWKVVKRQTGISILMARKHRFSRRLPVVGSQNQQYPMQTDIFWRMG